MTEKLLNAALTYAEKFGWAVFPLCPGQKEPHKDTHGCSEATTNLETIRAWWRKWPRSNIAMNVGKSGLVAIDIDVRDGVDGLETWRDLEMEYGFQADTVTNLTPSGGQHLLFIAPGVYIGPNAGNLGPGIDVRADNSYIILPPSQVGGKTYTWELSARPGECAIMPLPSAILSLLEKQPAPPLPEIIPEGERNSILTSLAGSMRRRGASEAAILAALKEENAARCKPPLPEKELENIARSMVRYPPGAQPKQTKKLIEIGLDEPETLEVLFSTDEAIDDFSTWLDSYFAFASYMVSAPASYHQTVGLSLLSIVIGRKAGIELKHGRIYPNLWGLLVGPSTVYHKTSSIRLGRGFVEQIDPDLVYPDDVTPEAMVSDVMTERSAGIVMRDEFAGWLLSARRDYKSDLKDLYMSLFDCPSTYKRTLRVSGTVTVDCPYLCLVSAVVPIRFYNAIKDEDWTNGFLARFLFALPDGEPDFDARPELMTDGDKEERAQLIGNLQAIYDHYSNQGGVIYLGLGDGVLDRYAKYVRDTQRRAYEHDYRDLMLPFAGRLSDYVLKLAMLVQVARGLDETGQFTPPPFIDIQSLRRAIRYAEGYAEDALRLIEERERIVSGALMQKVFRVIARFGEEGATHKEILPMTNLKADIFRQVIEKLAQVGAIEIKRVKTSPKARRSAKHYTATANYLPIRKW